MQHRKKPFPVTGKVLVIRNRRRAYTTIGILLGVIAIALGLLSMWTHPMPDEAPPLTYDAANEKCGWIAAADNVSCYVIPDRDGWQATTERPEHLGEDS